MNLKWALVAKGRGDKKDHYKINKSLNNRGL